MPPYPPWVLAPPVLNPILVMSTLNCFQQSCSDDETCKECQIEID